MLPSAPAKPGGDPFADFDAFLEAKTAPAPEPTASLSPSPQIPPTENPFSDFDSFLQAKDDELEAQKKAKLQQIQQAQAYGDQQAAALGLNQPDQSFVAHPLDWIGRNLEAGVQDVNAMTANISRQAMQYPLDVYNQGGGSALPPAIGEALKQAAEAGIASQTAKIDAARAEAERLGSDSLGGQIVRTIPQMGAAIGSTLVAGPAGPAAFFGAQQQAASYEEARSRGVDPLQAETAASLAGLASGMLNSAGAEALTGRLQQVLGPMIAGKAPKLAKAITKNWLGSVAAAVGFEMPQEALDETTGWAAEVATGKFPSAQEAVANWFERAPRAAAVAGGAALFGAGIGHLAARPGAAEQAPAPPPQQEVAPPTPVPVQEAQAPPPPAAEPIRVPEVEPLPPQPEVVPVEAAPAPTPTPAQPAPPTQEVPSAQEAQAEPVLQHGPDLAEREALRRPGEAAQAEGGRAEAPADVTPTAPRVEEPAAPGPAPVAEAVEPAPAAALKEEVRPLREATGRLLSALESLKKDKKNPALRKAAVNAAYDVEHLLPEGYMEDVLNGNPVDPALAIAGRDAVRALEQLPGRTKPSSELVAAAEEAIQKTSPKGSGIIAGAAAVPTPEPEPDVRGMAASQATPTLAIPTNLAPPTKAQTPIGTTHVNEALSYIWNVPVRYKHFRKRALGIFKVHPEVVRLKGEGDIAATAHEVAHFLDKQNPAYRNTAPAGAESELIALGKALYGGKHNNDFYASEGFAEYMRLRLSRDDAATQAPEFNQHFEGMVAQDPTLQKKLSDSKAVYDRWRQQAPIERAKGQIDFEAELGKPSAKQRVADAGRATISGMIDSWAPVDQATNALVEKAGLARKDLPASADPYRILAAYEGSEASIAKHMMLEGVRDLKGDLIAPSVKDALAKVEAKDYRDFFAYTLAKRTVELSGRGKKTGLSLEDANALIAAHETPEWQEAARGLNAYANGLVDLLEQSGALTPEQSAKIKESEWYIPLTRVYQVGAGEALASSYPGRGGPGVGSPLKRLTGSERPIQDPLLSLAQLTERVVGASTKSRVFRALYNLQSVVPGAGEIVEEVDAPLKVNSLTLDQIRKQLEDLGVEVPEDADGDAILTVFSNSALPKGPDPIVTGVVNGQRKFLFVKDPFLYASLSNLPSPWQAAVNKLWPLQRLSSAVRLGATGLNPGFGLITNFIRDAWTGTLQTVKNPGTFIARMARSAGPKGPLDKLFYAGGGEMASPLGVDIKHFRVMRRDIAAKTRADVVRNHLLHGIDSLREVIAFSETYGRRGEFRKVYESEMARTGDKESALIAAQEAASEVTVNFRRAGVYGRALNQIIPFYNVAIQGPRAAVKAFQRSPTKAFLTATASLTVPALALYALHRDEDWYQELPLWEKALFLHFKVGEKVIRLPLPFEWGIVFATLPVAAMERWRSGDKQRFEDTAGVMLDGLLPGVLPAGLRQVYEWSANENLLTGQAIESERLKRVLPEDRFYETTSLVYRKIGKMLGLSPVKIQNTVEGLTGGLSRNFTDVLKERKQTEAADIPVVGRLFSRRLRTGQSVSDVYSEGRAAESAYASILMYLDKGDMKEVKALEEKYKDLLGLDPSGPLEKGNTRERYPRLYKLRDATKLLREAKGMGDTVAATRIARIALGREKAEDYPELGGEE